MIALYRHFDSLRNLLYVGISLDAIKRLRQHGHTSDWCHQIASVEIEQFANRQEAMKAEREAILSEKPAFNVRRRPRQRKQIAFVQLSRDCPLEIELVSELRPKIQSDGFGDVAAQSGIDRATLHRLSHGEMAKLTLRTAQKLAKYLDGDLRFVRNGHQK